jgi:AGCS family alanine or glycine:cation symporter
LTAWAFHRGLSPIGDWGNLLVTFSVFLFALSTMISWSYYGDRCIEYLFGVRYVLAYRLVYVVFIFIGSVAALRIVWDFGDLALGLMAIPNLIAVVLLLPQVVRLTNDYFKRMASGDGDAGDAGDADDGGAGDASEADA